MRFATLLTIPLLTITLTAQQFSAEQRQELRKIIREEIHAAMSALHGGHGKGGHGNEIAVAVAAPTVQARRITKRAPKAVKKTTIMRFGKPIEGKHAHKKGNVVFFSANSGEPIEIKFNDLTTDMMGLHEHLLHIHPKFSTKGVDGSVILELEAKIEGATDRPTLDLLFQDPKPAKAKKAKKGKKTKKGKKGKKSKKAKNKKRSGVMMFSTDGGLHEVDLSKIKSGAHAILELSDIPGGHKVIELDDITNGLHEFHIGLSAIVEQLKKVDVDLSKIDDITRLIELDPDVDVVIKKVVKEECCTECESEACCEVSVDVVVEEVAPVQKVRINKVRKLKNNKGAKTRLIRLKKNDNDNSANNNSANDNRALKTIDRVLRSLRC